MTWYAFPISETEYGIFDSFESEDCRQVHLNDELPTALGEVVGALCG